jgi:hypothetical protein
VRVREFVFGTAGRCGFFVFRGRVCPGIFG